MRSRENRRHGRKAGAWMHEMGELFKAALDFVLPRHCIVCGCELGLKEKHLCLNCMADLPFTRNWAMLHNPMADEFNALLERMQPGPPMAPEEGGQRNCGDVPEEGGQRYCGNVPEEGGPGGRAGPRGPEPYARAAALLFYSGDSPYSRIPQALKYKGDIAAGRFFAGMLGRLMAEQPHWQDVDAVIPVPLHWRRKHARGYNQAEVIAAELARALGARLYPHALRRVRRTRSQTSLSAADRLKNVSGVFEMSRVRQSGRSESSNKLIVARHVVLVDDTFTTGATLAACRKVLREALGPDVLISVATLAAVSK